MGGGGERRGGGGERWGVGGRRIKGRTELFVTQTKQIWREGREVSFLTNGSGAGLGLR